MASNRPSSNPRQRLRRRACQINGAVQGITGGLDEARLRCFTEPRLEELRAAADQRQPRGAGGDEAGGERVDMARGKVSQFAADRVVA